MRLFFVLSCPTKILTLYLFEEVLRAARQAPQRRPRPHQRRRRDPRQRWILADKQVSHSLNRKLHQKRRFLFIFWYFKQKPRQVGTLFVICEDKLINMSTEHDAGSLIVSDASLDRGCRGRTRRGHCSRPRSSLSLHMWFHPSPPQPASPPMAEWLKDQFVYYRDLLTRLRIGCLLDRWVIHPVSDHLFDELFTLLARCDHYYHAFGL